MRPRRLLALLAAIAAGPALGQAVSTSAGPEWVAVTVYRDPDRSVDEAFELPWLDGYALISERRTVDIPAGEAEIRFEGVAGGIQPESAIVAGLPGGVIEKNRDAWLLSPGSLLDASLGRRVHIRRTSTATGKVTETEAVIRTGAGGAVVLETPAGSESLRCTGQPETLLYDRVPPGLSATPTLSVRTRSPAAARATITLSYLATGFDWQADYVAELSIDGKSMDLFAWLTLANGDETGFHRADTQAVAGRVEREEVEEDAPEAPPITLTCWPAGTTTSDLREIQPPPPPAPPPAPSESITVTGSRLARRNLESASPVAVLTAEQSELGDLKLYRIPEPVTVAAKSQKQVALLHRERVPVEIVYRYSAWNGGSPAATLVTRNRTADRLGLPLPGGRVAFFQQSGGRRILVGRGKLGDRAVGEKVEIEIARSTDVQVSLVEESERIEGKHRLRRMRLTVTNAKAHAVPFEAWIAHQPFDIASKSAKLTARDGGLYWVARVPANGTAIFRFTRRENP